MPRRRRGLLHCIQTHPRLLCRAPRPVDATPRHRLPQPVRQVARRFDRCQIPVQAQENVLCQVLGNRTVSQKVPADRIDHRLMLADDLRKRWQRCSGRGWERELHCYKPIRAGVTKGGNYFRDPAHSATQASSLTASARMRRWNKAAPAGLLRWDGNVPYGRGTTLPRRPALVHP